MGEAEVQKYRDQKTKDDRRIRELEEQIEELGNQAKEAQRKMQMEVDVAQRNEAMAKENAAIEKQHLELVNKQKQRLIDEAAQEASDKERMHQRGVKNYTQRIAELEVDLDKEVQARKDLMNRIKELNHRTELDI